MAKTHPELMPLKELRATLSGMRLSRLAVGADGRNRCLLSAFSSRTGRNQPSNAESVFGPAVWMRGLIKPGEGRGIAYIDWSQQEFGIAAGLSGDARMMDAYASGDRYKQLAGNLSAALRDNIPEAREHLKTLIGTVKLYPDAGNSHLEAEVQYSLEGLLSLASGEKFKADLVAGARYAANRTVYH